MDLSIWFWLCLFLFVLGYGWNVNQPGNKAVQYGAGVLLALMLLILGMAQFGGPVK